MTIDQMMFKEQIFIFNSDAIVKTCFKNKLCSMYQIANLIIKKGIVKIE